MDTSIENDPVYIVQMDEYVLDMFFSESVNHVNKILELN